MLRRSFLRNSALLGAGALYAKPPREQGTSDAAKRRKHDATTMIADDALRLEDNHFYFHDSRMKALLRVSELDTPRCEVMVYYYPSWHPTAFMEKYLGVGWTEFDLLARSRPLFPGHQMPRYPMLGRIPEADPAGAAMEIDLAAEAGITGWMIDWYWHNGTQFFHEQLEDGFLKTPNRSKLKFAIMWANHDWKNYFPGPSPAQSAVMIEQHHSIADCDRVAAYCCSHYFNQPNYWRIQGRPVFAIFDFKRFVNQLGESDTKRALQTMRERALKEGIGEIHIQASHSYDPASLKSYGIDSATLYHTFGWTYTDDYAPGTRIAYGEGAEHTLRMWQEHRKVCSVPFFPDCPVGWDDSARFGTFSNVVYERTPDQFEQLCRAGRHLAPVGDQAICFISSWNEWTEDHVLLPDSYFGYGYLDALRRAFA